jgi:hypothetical protein
MTLAQNPVELAPEADPARALAPEADPARAPDLLEGAATIELSAPGCSLDYWIRSVAQGTLALDGGSGRAVDVPSWMTEEGPLRDALIEELAFRSIAEEKATRALSYLVVNAPDTASMEFFTTQLLDEARHASAFRGHVARLGIDPADIPALVEKVAGADRDRILSPLESFGLSVGRDTGDYIGGVVVLTVLVEGVLAPAAELSERKWRTLDPAAARVERLAGIDEIRHLSVGSAVIRDHLRAHPGERARLTALVQEGRELWMELPVFEVIQRREELFQTGLEARRDVVGDQELWAGRRLVDTTPDERLLAVAEWSERLQDSRLAYMGLD